MHGEKISQLAHAKTKKVGTVCVGLALEKVRISSAFATLCLEPQLRKVGDWNNEPIASVLIDLPQTGEIATANNYTGARLYAAKQVYAVERRLVAYADIAAD